MIQPVDVRLEDLHITASGVTGPGNRIESMAVSPDGSKVYLGQSLSYDRHRRNLIVLTLNLAGEFLGPVRRYRDTQNVAFMRGDRVDVTTLLVSAKYRKLYVGCNQIDSHGIPLRRVLSVYDLDSSWEPQAPRSYEYPYLFSGIIGTTEKLQAMALHPHHGVLYLSGFGASGVYCYSLTGQGEPDGVPNAVTIGEHGKVQIAVQHDKLYLGTVATKDPITGNDLASGQIEIVQLNPASGMPQNPVVYVVPPIHLGTTQSYQHFQTTSYALVTPFPDWPGSVADESRTPSHRPGSLAPPLFQLSLDNAGSPIAVPAPAQRRLSLPPPPQAHTWLVASDPASDTFWMAKQLTLSDAFSGKAFPFAYTAVQFTRLPAGPLPELVPGFFPEPIDPFPPVPIRNPLLMAVIPNGSPVVLSEPWVPVAPDNNETADIYLKFTIQSPNPISHIQLEHRGVAGAVSIPLTANTSAPIPLDRLWKDASGAFVPTLKDRAGQQVIAITSSAATPAQKFKIEIEIYEGTPSGPSLKTLTETVTGNTVLILIPGYQYLGKAQRIEQIETLSAHVQSRLTLAQKVGLGIGLPGARRPQQFSISAYGIWGDQAHMGQLASEAETVAQLGINTLKATSEQWDHLPPADIRATLTGFGISQSLVSVSNPLAGTNVPLGGYFDFTYTQAELDTWATSPASQIADYLGQGATAAEVMWIQLADEPGWYYPEVVEKLRTTPEWLLVFQGYISAQGATLKVGPDFFGVTSWNSVLPLGASGAGSVEGRRLYYWTMRFVTESASLGFKRVRDTLRRGFPNAVAFYVNWNNFFAEWYTASPNVKMGNNPDTGPDAATGNMDWMASGRMNSHTPWSEDWFADHEAYLWSFRADLLRSSVMLGSPPFSFGAHVAGLTLGDIEEGTTYRVLTLVGRGAKYIDFYTFGPWFLFSNGWSENLRAYPEIANATQTLAEAEALLYAGQPLRGQVAILLPSSSGLWDESAGYKLYQMEIMWLHTALVYAGYHIDFLDETDIEKDQLSLRGYSVLYVTGPNLNLDRQQQIALWVQAGGTVAITPGAATADEYNTPTNFLDSLLGLKNRSQDRTITDQKLERNESLHGLGESVELFGPTVALERVLVPDPLEPVGPGAVVLARFSNGQAALSSRNHGAGQALAYGFFPGYEYFKSQYTENPVGSPVAYPAFEFPRWGKAQRDYAVAPARLANTPKLVEVSHEGVEVCRLDSAQGTALILLNWTNEAIPSLTLSLRVNDIGAFQTASTLKQPIISQGVLNGDLIIMLPIHKTEIVLLHR